MAEQSSQGNTLEPCGDPSSASNASSTATVHLGTYTTHETAHNPTPHEYYSAPEVYYPPEPNFPEPVSGQYSTPGQDPLPEVVVKGYPSKDSTYAAAKKRICGMTPKLFTIVAIAVVVVALGVGVGVGVGVSV